VLPNPLVVKVTSATGAPVADVLVSWSVTSGGGSVSSASTTTDGAGQASVRWTLGTIAGQGRDSVTAVAADLSGSPLTFTATAQPGPPAALAFAGQPTNVTAMIAMSPAVQVAVRDAYGNGVATSGTAITVDVTSGTGPASAVLSGTRTRTTVNGVATFGDLSIDRAGDGYSFTATTTGLPNAVSSSFGVAPGASAKLVFVVQPGDAIAGGAIDPPVQVAVQDAGGNTVTSSAAPVTLAIGTNPGGGTLSGTATVNAMNGVATFSDLSIDKVAAGYTLTAVSGGLTAAASAAFGVAPGEASTLAFIVQPSDAVAGDAVDPPVQVAVQDAGGNTVTASTTPITLAIGTNPGNGTLSGTTTVNAVNGVATFSDLSVDRTGAGYTLTAAGGGLTGATSAGFSITPGPASALVFSVQPTDVSAATAISPAVRVSVQDASGNTVTASTASITLAIGTNPGGGTLSGTTVVNAVSGVATFPDLSIDKTGTGYALTAASGTLTGAASAEFSVTPGAPSALAFTVQPTEVTAGAAISPAVEVTVRDASGNTVNASTASIALAIGANPGGGTLSGTTTANAVSGVATFPDLSIDRAGLGYTLTAAGDGLTGATSSGFDVISVASQMSVLYGDNQTSLAGFATNMRPAVRVSDAGDLPLGGVEVVFTPSVGGSVLGSTVVTDANGVAQVGSWTPGSLAGAATLTAAATGTILARQFNATVQNAAYDIDVRNVGPPFSTAVQEAFSAAETLWEQVIYGDQPDVPISTTDACGLGVTISETVDDVIILAQFDSIDGPGSILGYAGACSIRVSNGLTIYGGMVFDTADVAGLIATGGLSSVILHEMGHVLGFSVGTWNTPVGVTNQRLCAQNISAAGLDSYFFCTQTGATNDALAAFDSIGGTSYTGGNKVPLENCVGQPASCGAGTLYSHWRESTFYNELMTGYLNGGVSNPLSVLTIAAFGDNGYVVNYGAAQPYSRVFSAPAGGPPVAAGTIVNLMDDQYRGPVEVVDDRTGRVVRVVERR